MRCVKNMQTNIEITCETIKMFEDDKKILKNHKLQLIRCVKTWETICLMSKEILNIILKQFRPSTI